MHPVLSKSKRGNRGPSLCYTIPRRVQNLKFSKNLDNTNYVTCPVGTISLPSGAFLHFFKTFIMDMLFYLLVN